MIGMDGVLRAASAELEAFQARIGPVPYERKGVLYSEMFFLYLCARAARPARILESGRARGQSTALLAVLFPQLPVVSVEHDPASPDVAVAAERLRGFANVELRFGDATRLLPSLARPGDVALIDGPKGFRALRLALRLLAQGTVSMVFVHDVGPGTRERAFLERRLPGTLYSDEPRFAAIAHSLDGAAGDLPEGHRDVRCGYGFSLACIVRSAGTPYRLLWLAALLHR
jgi:hypothetical protein